MSSIHLSITPCTLVSHLSLSPCTVVITPFISPCTVVIQPSIYCCYLSISLTLYCCHLPISLSLTLYCCHLPISLSLTLYCCCSPYFSVDSSSLSLCSFSFAAFSSFRLSVTLSSSLSNLWEIHTHVGQGWVKHQLQQPVTSRRGLCEFSVSMSWIKPQEGSAKCCICIRHTVSVSDGI